MSMFCKVDNRRRSYTEHWRQAPNLKGFFIAALCKLLGIQRPHTFGIRRPETLDLHPESEVPRQVLDRLAPMIAKCAELNMPFRFYASIDAMIGASTKGTRPPCCTRTARPGPPR